MISRAFRVKPKNPPGLGLLMSDASRGTACAPSGCRAHALISASAAPSPPAVVRLANPSDRSNRARQAMGNFSSVIGDRSARLLSTEARRRRSHPTRAARGRRMNLGSAQALHASPLLTVHAKHVPSPSDRTRPQGTQWPTPILRLLPAARQATGNFSTSPSEDTPRMPSAVTSRPRRKGETEPRSSTRLLC